jgi:hypothetical protein
MFFSFSLRVTFLDVVLDIKLVLSIRGSFWTWAKSALESIYKYHILLYLTSMSRYVYYIYIHTYIHIYTIIHVCSFFCFNVIYFGNTACMACISSHDWAHWGAGLMTRLRTMTALQRTFATSSRLPVWETWTFWGRWMGSNWHCTRRCWKMARTLAEEWPHMG